MENKENARPYGASNGSAGTSNDDDDSDSNDGPILYRDDPVGGGTDRAAKIARKESLSLKLALRPDRQELINRNILRLQNENEESRESKEAIGARLIRRLSMRPTAEELVERNILKSKFWHLYAVHEFSLLTFLHLCSSNTRGTKEIQRGEEELFAAQT